LKRFAVDSGPLVAYLNRNDEFHEWAVETLDALGAPLHTCESVASEACFLLRGVRSGPQAVLALASRGRLKIDFRLDAEIAAVERLIAKYASVPMSLADACLVRMTELHSDTTVVTLDRDFTVYRRHGRGVVPVILP
jgi:predicted nucleic acid-binding protein